MDRARITALTKELEAIHFANARYWIEGAESDRAARAAYFRRQGRLLEIRAQLAVLMLPLPVSIPN